MAGVYAAVLVGNTADGRRTALTACLAADSPADARQKAAAAWETLDARAHPDWPAFGRVQWVWPIPDRVIAAAGWVRPAADPAALADGRECR